MWLVPNPLRNIGQGFLRFVRRRRRLIIFLTVAGVGGYVVVRRVRAKYRELTDLLEAETLSEARLHTYFDSNQRASAQTVHSLLPAIKARLFELYDLESLTARLKTGRIGSEPISAADKLSTWNQLKILSFTRTITAVYAVCLTDALIRTQLSIIGRFLYSAAASSISNPFDLVDSEQLSEDTSQRFLCYAEYVQKEGLVKVAARVQHAVADVLGPYSLKSQVTFDELCTVVTRIRVLVEHEIPRSSVSTTPSVDVQTGGDGDAGGEGNIRSGGADAKEPEQVHPSAPSAAGSEPVAGAVPAAAPIGNAHGHVLTQCVMAPEGEYLGAGDEADLKLRMLLDEARDLLESPDLAAVLQASLDVSFSVVLGALRVSLFVASAAGTGGSAASTGLAPATDITGAPGDAAADSSPSRADERGGAAVAVPLARVIPAVNNAVHGVLAASGNECLRSLAHQDAVRAYMWMIYTATPASAPAVALASPGLPALPLRLLH